MARVFLRDHAATAYGLFAAKLGVALGRPVKYPEVAEVLAIVDDEMLAVLAERYITSRQSRQERTA